MGQIVDLQDGSGQPSESDPEASLSSNSKMQDLISQAAHNVEAQQALIHKILDDGKAEDILTIDLRGKSPLSDFMMIASGRVQRHVNALTDDILKKLKEAKVEKLSVEGLQECDWVLIDTGDIILHIFRPEVREFYNLERMWSTPTIPQKVVKM